MSKSLEKSDMGKIPIISMWQPWVWWVMLRWKTIETRTHKRFASLEGKTIGIHAALKWDDRAIEVAKEFLSSDQIKQTLEMLKIGGVMVGTVFVQRHRELWNSDSQDSLIDCKYTKRWGLVFRHVKVIEDVPMKGKQGIWYFDRQKDVLP